PDTFELLIELDGFEAEAEVIWRKQGEVGIEFVSQPEMVKPKRTQVVTSHGHMRKASLRKDKTRSRRSEPALPAKEHADVAVPGAAAVENSEPTAAAVDQVAAPEFAENVEIPVTPGVFWDDSKLVEPRVDTAVADEAVEHTDDMPAPEAGTDATPVLSADDNAKPAAINDAVASTDNTQDSLSMAQANATADSSLPADQTDSHDDAGQTDTAGDFEPRPEVPMFRDQVQDGDDAFQSSFLFDPQSAESKSDDIDAWATDEIEDLPEETAAQSGNLDTEAVEPEPIDTSDAPVEIENTVIATEDPLDETMGHIRNPLSSRMETALQAPKRAAKNLGQPLVPITPAPVFETATAADDEDAAMDVGGETEVTSETPDEDADKVLPAEQDVETNAAVEEDVAEAPTAEDKDEPEASAEPSAQPELRADLAAFVSEFSAHAPAPASAVQGDVVAEAPETNVVALADARETDVGGTAQKAPADRAEPIVIVDDVIVVEEAAAIEPQKRAESAPVSDETDADILPCADADADGWTPPVADETEESAELNTPDVEPAVLKTPCDVSGTDDAADEAPVTPEPKISRNIPILIAEDDPDDRMFMREAFGESDFEHDIAFVENGEELLRYLNGEGDFADRKKPELILLDLNMPKMDGRTALLHIKANPSLRRIPIIVLTTSKADDDIEKTYDLGVSSYISKPSSAEGLKEVIGTLNTYWSNLVAFPANR
ncbi:MAG: response regulator, partial [Hyphomicrobiaceae bacterium]